VNVASLDIRDWNEFSSKVQPQSPSTLSHLRPKLPRWSDILAATGVHGHTSTRVLHGRGEQPSHLIFRNTIDRFFCNILRIHVSTLYSFGKMNAKHIGVFCLQNRVEKHIESVK